MHILVRSPGLDRQHVDESGGANARNDRYAIDERLIKVRQHIAAFISNGGNVQIDGEDMRGIEAKVDMAITRHVANQHSGHDQKHES